MFLVSRMIIYEKLQYSFYKGNVGQKRNTIRGLADCKVYQGLLDSMLLRDTSVEFYHFEGAHLKRKTELFYFLQQFVLT